MGRRYGGVFGRRAVRFPRFQVYSEDLADRATKAVDGRISPLETAATLESDAADAAKAAEISPLMAPPGEQKRLRELITACGQASHLGRYYAERFLSAYRAGQAHTGTGQCRCAAQTVSESQYAPFTSRTHNGVPRRFANSTSRAASLSPSRRYAWSTIPKCG